MARCHTHNKHSASCRHYRLPRKRRWWSRARHPLTGAEPGVFGKCWSLASTLSLPIGLQLRTASVLVSPSAGQHVRVQLLPCRWTPRAQRLLLSSAFHRGSWPATPEDPSPLPRPRSLQGQVGISSRSRSSQPREPGKPHPHLQAIHLQRQREGLVG